MFLALEHLQEVVDEKRDVVMGCAPYTAILWRNGEMHYGAYFEPDEMTWTDGLLIGLIASTKVVDWHDRILTEMDQDGLDKISRSWVSALTGLESRQVSIDLANGRISAHYGIEGIEINPATFVGEFVDLDLSEAATAEDYLDLLESQLEALLAPLSDPSLYLKQVEDFTDDLWFQDDLLAEEVLDAIEWLRVQRDLSDALWSARDHLRMI